MDSLITAAGRALAAGDPLGALKRIALRDDAPALALRGIAMAQLGDLVRARSLLRRAGAAFGSKEIVPRARCVVAEAEIAFASRDLGWPVKALKAARLALEDHGDHANAAHARYLEVRRLLLIGRLEEAERIFSGLDLSTLTPALRTIHELAVAGIAMRRVRARAAGAALARAEEAARWARIPSLAAEVEQALMVFEAPAARLIAQGQVRHLRLEVVETRFATEALVIDAGPLRVRQAEKLVATANRRVVFALRRAQGEAGREDGSRGALFARGFRGKSADDSHRARLRVEIGRLRAAPRPFAGLNATRQGFVLAPRLSREVVVLAPPVEEQNAEVLAFLADGESWSSSALALALGASQRTVQRALDALAAAGKVQWFGKGRARRWMTPPLPGFATMLLLPVSVAGD